ncbi:MAG: permease [Actinomycetota bacterium]|nr:permease [Actinomycetota bacterium]
MASSSPTVMLRRPAGNLLLGGMVVIAAALVAATRLAGIGSSALAETFVLIFTSIVVEALPFVLVGAIVSAGIEVFVPNRAFERLARLPLPLQVPGAALGGLAFPVCECGSVPVARRLISRGMHPAAGLAFMIASPIMNPIVLASTWIAYQGRGIAVQMVLGRAGLGLLLAMVAGWAIGGEGARDILRARPDDEHAPPTPTSPGDRTRAFTDHLAADFFFMGKFVVIGSALAAALQSVVPQTLLSGVARTPILGALALMALAFLLSLCSEADAFVAVSFVQFPIGSQLAFLVFGPVVDAKLAFLYGATFRRRFVVRLVVVAAPIVLAGSLWFEVLMR